MIRIFPFPLVSIPRSPAAVRPLLRLSIPTKQVLLVPTISELKVTTGIFFSSIKAFSFSRTVSLSTGMIASPRIPSCSSSSMACSCSSSSTERPSFRISWIPFSFSSTAAFSIPRFTSCIKEDLASCVTTPIFSLSSLAVLECFRSFCTYPISSARRQILSATSGLIRPLWFNALSTVPLETPACSAICCIVTAINPSPASALLCRCQLFRPAIIFLYTFI